MNKIAILVPTKGRPELFRNMVKSVMRTTTTNVVIYVYMQGEEDINSYDLNNFEALKTSHIGLMVYAAKEHLTPPAVYLWNKLAEIAEKEPENRLFMLGSDDMVFATPGWDTALLEHYEQLKEKTHVYHLQDSRDKSGTPHPIVTREYMDAMGYFVPPIFLHWYVDAWTVAIAKVNDCFTYFTDYELIHDKPNDRGKPDATHTNIRKMGWHQRDWFVNRKSQHFLEYEKQRLKEKLAS